VDVAVATPGGSDVLGGAYTYVVAPSLLAVLPPVGSSSGGETVTLTGSGLSGVTGVTFGGQPGTDVLVLSDSALTVTTPALPAGAVDVEVSTPGGAALLTGGYTYVDGP
jgi:hypothetical protein